MKEEERKQHWDKIYASKELEETSWYQQFPSASLHMIAALKLAKSASIIDIGGGESLFVDHLLTMGFEDISVLDISEAAIEKAKLRLGSQSKQVNWIISDVISFEPERQYELWHDRATFHFLIDKADISRYIEITAKAIKKDGFLTIGTFSEEGPDRCSGLEIKQYSENSLVQLFSNDFEMIRCFQTDHQTPSGELQNFVFCSFRKS